MFMTRNVNRIVVCAVPPSSVEIVDQSSGSKLEIQENHELVIECLARNSKPASRIVWFRSNAEINPGEYRTVRTRDCRIRVRHEYDVVNVPLTVFRVLD